LQAHFGGVILPVEQAVQSSAVPWHSSHWGEQSAKSNKIAKYFSNFYWLIFSVQISQYLP